MAQMSFRNGESFYAVLENAPFFHLMAFLCQAESNFKWVSEAARPLFKAGTAEKTTRTELIAAMGNLSQDQATPVEVECQRVLMLNEGKGPSSLQTVLKRRLPQDQYEEFQKQPDDLARSIWAHVQHRREFDDAISFRNTRAWRETNRLFSAFEIDSKHGSELDASDVDPKALAESIRKKLGATQACSVSLLELPAASDYPPSVMAIVRMPGHQSSVPVHLDEGGRQLLYYLPQEEVILIYTPSLQKIEVAGRLSAMRHDAATCFSIEVLHHDISAKPLTWACFETSRFLRSLDLSVPSVPGFTVLAAKVVEFEVRLQSWKTRLSLKVSERDDMVDIVRRYLDPGGVLRRALGFSKVMIAVTFERPNSAEPEFVEIMISDRNTSNLHGIRDPEVRRMARSLLVQWGVIRTFKDLEEEEATAMLAVLSELYELDSEELSGTFFTERGIETLRLQDAGLIRRKEIDPELIDEEADPESFGPTLEDRTRYTIQLDWLGERLVAALRPLIDHAHPHEQSPGFSFLGNLNIDGQSISCYLARGLGDNRRFVDIDVRLRAMAANGPGIVFTGRSPGWVHIAANVIVPIVSGPSGALTPVDRAGVIAAFKAGRALALGYSAVDLIDIDDETAELRVPGKTPLLLRGVHKVRCFNLLVDSFRRNEPGVRTAKLIEGSQSSGLEQMFGTKQWKVIKTGYVESPQRGIWRIVSP